MSHISYDISKLCESQSQAILWWRVWFCLTEQQAIGITHWVHINLCFFFQTWISVCEKTAIFELHFTFCSRSLPLFLFLSLSLCSIYIYLSTKVAKYSIAINGHVCVWQRERERQRERECVCRLMMLLSVVIVWCWRWWNRYCRCCFHVINSDNGVLF